MRHRVVVPLTSLATTNKGATAERVDLIVQTCRRIGTAGGRDGQSAEVLVILLESCAGEDRRIKSKILDARLLAEAVIVVTIQRYGLHAASRRPITGGPQR